MSRPLSRLVPAFLLLAATPAAAEVPIDVMFDSEVYIDGLIQADVNVFDSDEIQFADDWELRRAEIVFRAKHVSGLEVQLGYDPKADKWLDASVKDRLTPYTSWRVGQFKQPNSMEELASTRHNEFISKAMVTNTFAVARRLGAELSTEHRNWSVTGAWFGRELTRNLGRGSGYGARATWAPVLELDEFGYGDVLHFGVSAISLDTSADTLRLRARPAADLTPIRLVDTGTLTTTDRQTTFGAEMAWSQGPLLLQGEYFRSRIERTVGEDFDADGWYVQGVWSLTGERHGYKGGAITTALPDDPLKGAWSVGLRYEGLDLDDVVRGGEQNAWTAGVNWYWRTNFKFMANYVAVQSERRGVEDNPNIFEFRAQMMF
jgi:phosphate-selective porin OprO/OprP